MGKTKKYTFIKHNNLFFLLMRIEYECTWILSTKFYESYKLLKDKIKNIVHFDNTLKLSNKKIKLIINYNYVTLTQTKEKT